jgi:hypothetical protein
MPTTGNGAALFSGMIANFAGPFHGRLMKLIEAHRFCNAANSH